MGTVLGGWGSFEFIRSGTKLEVEDSMKHEGSSQLALWEEGGPGFNVQYIEKKK